MCEKTIERLPSMTAGERQQLRHNCARAILRASDHLVVQEAHRILAELDALERRESRFLDRMPTARKIEYAFRRLPANQRERQLIRILHENSGAPTRKVSAALGNIDDRSWLRQFWEMCQDRRHLIGVAGSLDDAATMTCESATMPVPPPLLEVNDAGQEVRLIPEAVVAFASIGYVGHRAA